jgi:hypothetical protein
MNRQTKQNTMSQHVKNLDAANERCVNAAHFLCGTIDSAIDRALTLQTRLSSLESAMGSAYQHSEWAALATQVNDALPVLQRLADMSITVGERHAK